MSYQLHIPIFVLWNVIGWIEGAGVAVVQHVEEEQELEQGICVVS